MQRLEGVKYVKVDLDSKTAVAVYDSTVTTAEEIAAASTDVGFPAKLAGDS
jgi:mercuric ion binding protein